MGHEEPGMRQQLVAHLVLVQDLAHKHEMLIWWQVLSCETCCKLRLEGLCHLGHACAVTLFRQCHAEAATKLCVLDGDNKNLSKALTLTSPNGCNMSCTHTYIQHEMHLRTQ